MGIMKRTMVNLRITLLAIAARTFPSVEFTQAQRGPDQLVPETALEMASCEMDPSLVASFSYTSCEGTLPCPTSGFIQYTADCHMYAEMKYAIGTIWYTGVVVPAQKPDSAVAAKCIEHVVTGSSDCKTGWHSPRLNQRQVSSVV